MHDVVFFNKYWSPFVRYLFYNTLKVKFMLGSNIKEDNCTILHAQNTTGLQSSTFLIEIHQLLVTNKGKSAFPQCKQLPRSTANSSVSISIYG